MKMELIQPFINAADAVLAQGLQGTTKVGNLSMEEEAYRRKGVAGMVALTGDIEGRIILDLDPQTAVQRGQPLCRRGTARVRCADQGNHLRTGQPGHGQCHLRAQRPGLPFPRASAAAADGRSRATRPAKTPKR